MEWSNMVRLFAVLIVIQSAVVMSMQHGENEMIISDDLMTFSEAEVFCRSQAQANLVSIDSEEKYDQVIEFIYNHFNVPKQRGESFWTSMELTTSGVRTIDNEPGYAEWSKMNPKAYPEYTMLNKILIATKYMNNGVNGMWNADGEQHKRYALCETDDGVLYFSPCPMNYADSVKYCETDPSYTLVQMEDADKFNQVVDWVYENFNKQRRRGESFWTGLTLTHDDARRTQQTDGDQGFLRWVKKKDSLKRSLLADHPDHNKVLISTKFVSNKAPGFWNWSDEEGNLRRALCDRRNDRRQKPKLQEPDEPVPEAEA